MKSLKTTALLFILFATLAACNPKSQEKYPDANKIAVSWELVSNFTDVPDGFKAKFTLTNHSGFKLDNKNWALFFNLAPKKILDNETPQPATIQNINGDWYKMVPGDKFTLNPGDSVVVNYRGIEGLIKETDGPLGLYFVFYNSAGTQDTIVQVADSKIVPFTRPEQMNRNADDMDSIRTPSVRFHENEKMHQISRDNLLPVIPTPVKFRKGKGGFTIDGQTVIGYQKGLENEAGFLAGKLKTLTGRDFKTEESPGKKGILLTLGNVEVQGKSHEAYHLNIDSDGIQITGGDAAGVFYGIESLLAMVPLENYQHASPAIHLPSVAVEDAPRFEYRGLQIDLSRNFQTKETLLRFLDILAFYKINRFLFYTTEDEGWRLAIDGLPELTEVGGQREHISNVNAAKLHPGYGSGPFAYDPGKHGSGFYTKEDFIEILKYAKARHIKVIPELNFPGHARAAIKAMEARYQRLMKEGKEKEANEYRLIDPDDKSKYMSPQFYDDDVVSVARESTYHFYEKVVDEIAKMYQAAGLPMNEIHAGGDEVADGAWTGSPMAHKLLAQHPEIKDPKNLQAYFFDKLLKRLENRHLRVDVWEEMALTKTPDGHYVPNPQFAGRNVVSYIWNNVFDYPDLGYKLANEGYQVVLCNVSNFYFDLAYNKDPKEPGLYWAGFVKTHNAWAFAPYDFFKTTFKDNMGKPFDQEKGFAHLEHLKPEARKNILGVEAQLWSETVKGRAMAEYYILPKLLGFAESAWAPERKWETIDDKAQFIQEMNSEWNVFANTLAQKELPKLAYINGGYNYRLPLPGAIIKNGELHANVEFPGLVICYTTDGTEPDINSTVYENPVKVSGTVRLKSFDAAGRSSRESVVR